MHCCARCGAECSSKVFERRGRVTAYYCDDPAAASATCYFLAKYSGFPEFDGL